MPIQQHVLVEGAPCPLLCASSPGVCPFLMLSLLSCLTQHLFSAPLGLVLPLHSLLYACQLTLLLKNILWLPRAIRTRSLAFSLTLSRLECPLFPFLSPPSLRSPPPPMDALPGPEITLPSLHLRTFLGFTPLSPALVSSLRPDQDVILESRPDRRCPPTFPAACASWSPALLP